MQMCMCVVCGFLYVYICMWEQMLLTPVVSGGRREGAAGMWAGQGGLGGAGGGSGVRLGNESP